MHLETNEPEERIVENEVGKVGKEDPVGALLRI